MDIAKLGKKRQLNVQEQNALLQASIRREAVHWREVGIPVAMHRFLLNQSIDPVSSIFFNYDQDFPGCSSDMGTVLTADGRFFEFEVDLNDDRSELVECHVWQDVTARIEINPRKPGTGASRGCLALRVLQELADGVASRFETS